MVFISEHDIQQNSEAFSGRNTAKQAGRFILMHDSMMITCAQCLTEVFRMTVNTHDHHVVLYYYQKRSLAILPNIIHYP